MLFLGFKLSTLSLNKYIAHPDSMLQLMTDCLQMRQAAQWLQV